MKKISRVFMVCLGLLMIIACNRPSPDQFFQTTVLNVNMIRDFSSENLTRELLSQAVEFEGHPESKKNGNEAQQVIENKVAYLQQTVERIEALTPPDEDGEIIKQRALDIYNFVLPVYKEQYMQMAKLCDNKGTKEEVEGLAIKIDEKYGNDFEKKHDELLSLGKAYAEKHNLNVQFD